LKSISYRGSYFPLHFFPRNGTLFPQGSLRIGDVLGILTCLPLVEIFSVVQEGTQTFLRKFLYDVYNSLAVS